MKYVFFTGATGGLGFPCVKALSERGYAVFAAGTNPDRLAELGRLPNVLPVATDVTSMESIEAARRAVLEHTRALHAVVHFAGTSAFCSMVEGDCARVTERLLDINVLGAVRVNRVFFDLVRAGGGRIVHCSSEAGWMTPQPFAAPYFLSKHALEAYNDSLRRELMFLGVPVVKLQPGSFKTAVIDRVWGQFEKTLSDTAYYGDVLTRMKPLMAGELDRGGDPGRLALTLVKALEARRPRLRYRVGTGRLLALMELLPDGGVDRLYRLLFRLWKP